MLWTLANGILPPTGTFLDSAIDVIPKPSLTDADLRKRLMTAVRDAHAYGLTSVHDAALLPESLAFFKRYCLSCQSPSNR